MKKSSLLIVFVLLSSLLLAACQPEEVIVTQVVEKEIVVTEIVEVAGQETMVEVTKLVKEEVVVTATPEPVETQCNIEPPAAKTRVNMIGWTYGIIDYYADEMEKCNEVENLTVNTQLLDSGSAHDQIRLALSSGSTSPYDIILDDVSFVAELADQGWLLPLDDLMEKYQDQYDTADFLDSLIAEHSVDGVIYGVPIEVNPMFLFYRSDLLEKYSLQVPETWDDVVAACKVLQDEESIELPFTINLHAGWAWRIEFNNMLRAFGGNYLNEDNTPAFNGPEGVAALEQILEIVDACMGEEGLTYSIDDSEIGMANGALAMVHTWATRAPSQVNPEKSDFVDTIKFAPAPRAIPGGYRGSGGGGASFSIPASTKVDPELAFRIIMEATDLDSQIGAAMYGIPSRAAVADVADAPYMSAAMQTVEEGFPSTVNPALGIMNGALGNWLPKVITGEMTVQEILDAAAEEYTREAIVQGYIQQ